MLLGDLAVHAFAGFLFHVLCSALLLMTSPEMRAEVRANM